MQITQKILAGLLLTFFVGGMFVSLFHLSVMMGGMSMTANTPIGMSDCPFESHGESICPMDLMSHIGAWKATFVAALPGFVSLLTTGGLLLLVASLAPNLLGQPRYYVSQYLGHIRERTYTYIYRFWQKLFSKGVLNPKLF